MESNIAIEFVFVCCLLFAVFVFVFLFFFEVLVLHPISILFSVGS